MKSKNRSVAVIALFAAAVIFFIAILVFAYFVPDEDGSKSIDNDIVITDMQVDVTWHKDRSCHVSQKIDVTFKQTRHGIYVDIPVNSGERVRDLTVKVTDYRGKSVPYEFSHQSGNNIVRAKIGDENKVYSSGNSIVCKLEYDYITPVHPDGKDLLDINAIGHGWACYIQKASVSVTLPTAINSSDVEVYVEDRQETPILTNDGKTVNVVQTSLSPYHGVRVKAKMPSGVLKSSNSFEGVVTVVVGVVIVVAVVLLMRFLGKDKPLTPVVNFYPPYTSGKVGRKRRMLPVQVGKIIDGNCSSEDVTSLIFYWASQGYLTIEEADGTTYLIKQSNVDPVTEYERKMFNSLFEKGTTLESGEVRVSTTELSGKFASSIATVKSAVNSEFRGAFYKPAFTALSIACAIGIALFAALNAMLATFRISVGFINFAGILLLVPVGIAYGLGTAITRWYFKLSNVKRNMYLGLFFAAVLLISVGVMLAVPTDAMGWTEKIVFGLCVGAASAVTPFLTRRKDEYTEQLNDIIGFRNFLRDAEKDRLETLIADSPQYYYDILPYANVLGVSDIWQDKFKDLKVEPPTYYRGSDISLFDIYIITRLSDSIGHSLTYVPPSASKGSFSGGGHFGGGGGSFGGFGGGGGGSW